MNLCGNEALAADLAQDTLVEGWKSLRRYDGRCQFFTWLCAIMFNRYHNTLRKRMPVPFSAMPSGDGEAIGRVIGSFADQSDSPDRAAELRERTAMVQQCLGKLSPKHQQVIHMRFYVEDSLPGIAAALGCSIGTVKSRLFHALEQLRKMNVLIEETAGLSAMKEEP